MGAPKDLSPAQLAQLTSLTTDKPEKDTVIHVGADGTATLTLPMHSNDIVLVTVRGA